MIINEAADIKAKNPGILEVPSGKSVDQLPVSHFKSLIDKIGREKVIRALTNLQVWNKNDNKKLSNWAKDMKDKIGDYGYKDESVKESIDPFKWLKKVKVGPSDPTPKGCVTDGNGNCYSVPTSGRSQFMYQDGFKFSYNYGTKELEMYYKGRIIDSIGLNVVNFLDNPEYWVRKMIDDQR